MSSHQLLYEIQHLTLATGFIYGNIKGPLNTFSATGHLICFRNFRSFSDRKPQPSKEHGHTLVSAKVIAPQEPLMSI